MVHIGVSILTAKNIFKNKTFFFQIASGRVRILEIYTSEKKMESYKTQGKK